jgi:very-short-patch-repair endonuclease
MFMIKPLKRPDLELHLGAGKKTFDHAGELRQQMTPAEEKLWQSLRNRKLCGFKFRRQHPLKQFIADFYCHERKLVIELDGEVHQKPDVSEHDEGRTFELERFGLKVLRFKNEEVLRNINKVLEKIKEVLKVEDHDLTPGPSPSGEG